MSQSPLRPQGSKDYSDAWRAINILIRSDGTWSGRERNLCFRNRRDGTFEDFSFLSGLDLDADGRAFVPLDFDGDGDQDLLLKNRNGQQLRAFRNDMRSGRPNSLTVRLQGTRSNRDGVGGRVWVTTDRRTLMREVVSGSGYLSQRSRVASFGLGGGETVRSVRIRWPLGQIQRFEESPRQRSIVVVEGEAGYRDAAPAGKAAVPAERAGAQPRLVSSGTWLARPVPAPDFALRVLNEAPGTLRLSEQRGGPVLLNFWATWCPPCRRELALLQGESGKLRDAGIKVLAVSVDRPAQSAAASALAAELGLSYPVLLADSKTAETYSILAERLFDRRRELAIPTSFLLDGEGRILKVFRGAVAPGQVLADAQAASGAALPFAGHWLAAAPLRDFQELASAFAERGLTGPARAMFDEALAQGARSPLLLNNLAGALLAEGETARAEALLREALAAAPRLTDAKVNLATLLIGRGAAGEAESLLEQAVEQQPGDRQALSALGSVRFSQARLAAAEALFRRAVKSGPEDPRLRENLGAALAARGKAAEALEEYEAARRLGGSAASIHTSLGILYMQNGRPGQGLQSFLDAAKADPDAPGPQLNLARHHLQTGDIDQARMRLRRARELAPNSLEADLPEVQALTLQGRPGAAKRAAQEAVRRHPESGAAKRLLESLE